MSALQFISQPLVLNKFQCSLKKIFPSVSLSPGLFFYCDKALFMFMNELNTKSYFISLLFQVQQRETPFFGHGKVLPCM